jgi:hypothetical protein
VTRSAVDTVERFQGDERNVIPVASKSVFSLFSAEEATFANVQLWKNLLRMSCTEQLWSGEREGHEVTVWGS